MSAGMPGAGIAGVFYLASALLMPVIELERTMRGESSLAAWRLVLRQFAVACAILAGVWSTGWALGLIALAPPTGPTVAGRLVTATPQVVGESAMLMSLVTVVVLVGGVEVLSAFRARTPRPAVPPAARP